MPRQTNPIEPVLRYFRTAPLDAAVLAISIVKDLVKLRQEAAAVTVAPATAPARRKPGPKPGRRKTKLVDAAKLHEAEIAGAVPS